MRRFINDAKLLKVRNRSTPFFKGFVGTAFGKTQDTREEKCSPDGIRRNRTEPRRIYPSPDAQECGLARYLGHHRHPEIMRPPLTTVILTAARWLGQGRKTREPKVRTRSCPEENRSQNKNTVFPLCTSVSSVVNGFFFCSLQSWTLPISNRFGASPLLSIQ
jgi:hypothetical protein